MAHWALGHLGLAAKRAGRPEQPLSLDEVSHAFHADAGAPATAGLAADELRAIEMQADFLASELLFVYHRAQDDTPFSILSAFAEAMPTLAAVGGTVVGTAEPATANRMLTAASGLVVLVMEARRRGREQTASASHPSPEARALQMLSVMFGLANRAHHQTRDDGATVIRGTSDEFIAEIEAMLRQQFWPLLVDMMAVSNAIDVPPLFLRIGYPVVASPDPDLASASATAQDFLLLMFEAVSSPDQLSTTGARELFTLKRLDEVLRKEAAPYALWHG
jgi:hypothetical protein